MWVLWVSTQRCSGSSPPALGEPLPPSSSLGFRPKKEPQSKVEDHMVPRGAAPQISGWTEPRAPHGGQRGASLLLPRGEQDLMLGAHSIGGHVVLTCPVSVGACVDQEGRLGR